MCKVKNLFVNLQLIRKNVEDEAPLLALYTRFSRCTYTIRLLGLARLT